MKRKKVSRYAVEVFVLAMLCCVPALAAGSGDVSGVVVSTWDSVKSQIKDVVDKVVFPAIDMILVVLLLVKGGTCYLEYRKHGQLDLTPIAILFVCLILTLTAPQFIWGIIGM